MNIDPSVPSAMVDDHLAQDVQTLVSTALMMHNQDRLDYKLLSRKMASLNGYSTD